MDHLARLIGLCVLLLMAGVMPRAHAAAPVSMFRAGSDPLIGYGATKEAACQAHIALRPDKANWVFKSADSEFCRADRISPPETNTVVANWTTATRCAPDGAAPDTTKPLAQQCADPAPACPGMGTDVPGTSGTQHTSEGYTGGLVCIQVPGVGGCAAYPSFAGKAPDGRWYANGPFTSAGFSCSGGTSSGGSAPDVQEPPMKCENGTCPGTGPGGNLMCVPCSDTKDKAPETKDSTTTNNPDGSTTKTDVTTNKQTTCTGEKCTTTTTTTTTTTQTPAGGGTPTVTTTTESKTDEEPKEDFCAAHPTSEQCKKSTFGGQCGGGFRCDGDAVQCAMAKEQHARMCQLIDTPSEWSTKGMTAMNDVAVPADHPGNSANVTTVSVAGGFDQTPMISGSCPSDISIRGASIPLSRVCTPAGWLGNFLVALTALVCLGIVFRGT